MYNKFHNLQSHNTEALKLFQNTPKSSRCALYYTPPDQVVSFPLCAHTYARKHSLNTILAIVPFKGYGFC